MARRVVGVYYRSLMATVVVLAIALTVVVAYQVFSRHLDVLPRHLWTEEISRFCFVWMLFLGAAIAVRDKSHFVIDMLPSRMGVRAERATAMLALALVAVVAIGLLLGGAGLVGLGLERRSSVSGLPLALPFAALPVAGFSMLAFTIEHMVDLVRGRPRMSLSVVKGEVAKD